MARDYCSYGESVQNSQVHANCPVANNLRY
jgi:hypothetical protein